MRHNNVQLLLLYHLTHLSLFTIYHTDMCLNGCELIITIVTRLPKFQMGTIMYITYFSANPLSNDWYLYHGATCIQLETLYPCLQPVSQTAPQFSNRLSYDRFLTFITAFTSPSYITLASVWCYTWSMFASVITHSCRKTIKWQKRYIFILVVILCCSENCKETE